MPKLKNYLTRVSIFFKMTPDDPKTYDYYLELACRATSEKEAIENNRHNLLVYMKTPHINKYFPSSDDSYNYIHLNLSLVTYQNTSNLQFDYSTKSYFKGKPISQQYIEDLINKGHKIIKDTSWVFKK